MSQSPREIPDHVSAIRQMTANSRGDQYRSVASLADAQNQAGYALIMEGDDGGQIYATCPVDLIRCGEECLRQLLVDVESLQWKNPVGCKMFFEYAPIGAHIAGGMGGGTIVAGVWCHKEIHAISMADAVEDVIEGRVDRLVVPSLESLEELGRRGDACAQFFVARRLRKSDPCKAIEWLRMAGEQEHLSAMNTLSCSSDVSAEERVCWMKAISKRSDLDRRIDWARFRLAHALENAEGVECDFAAAAELYEQCAKSRYSASAAVRLGEMYFDGKGVDKDLQLSAMWLILGSVPRRDKPPYWHAIARPAELVNAQVLLDLVKKELPLERIAEAERMAQRYFADEPGSYPQ